MAGLDDALAGAVAWIGGNLLVDTVRVRMPGTGAPVLDMDSGQLTFPAGDVLYEGPGAVLPQSTVIARPTVLDGVQPWDQETKSRYVLLTPLEAPIPPNQALVEVIEVHNPSRASLIGRSWLSADPGQVSTVEVVRRTPLDQFRAGSAT